MAENSTVDRPNVVNSGGQAQYVYCLTGVIAADRAAEFQQLVVAVGNSPNVRLDFSGVTRINSMGIALLLKALKELRGRGKTIQITGANKMTQTLFRMMGITKWATVLA